MILNGELEKMWNYSAVA